MRVARSGIVCLLSLATLVAPGCSISTSSNMASDSSESSESSSRSSASLARKVAYREDVRGLTIAYLQSGQPRVAFDRQLTTLARAYGLTDWESDELTRETISAAMAEVHGRDVAP